MADMLIKPLRAYEDRGTIRDVDNEPYAAPVWLAKELEQLKLCKIVGEVGGTGVSTPDSANATSALKIVKKGQRWIIADVYGAQVGDFTGKREEAEAELAKLLAAAGSDADEPQQSAAHTPAVEVPVSQGDIPPATEPAQPVQE